VLEPNAKYSHNWYIDAICAYLEASVTDGRASSAWLINAPPGAMKSFAGCRYSGRWNGGPKAKRSLRTASVTPPLTSGRFWRDGGNRLATLTSEMVSPAWPGSGTLFNSAVTAFDNTSPQVPAGLPGPLTRSAAIGLFLDDLRTDHHGRKRAGTGKTQRQFHEGASTA